MKVRVVGACLAVLVCSFRSGVRAEILQTGQAETAAGSPAEPQYVNQYFSLGADGKLVALETASVHHETKSHNNFISVKVASVDVIQGESSPIHLQPGATFIVRMNVGDVDPVTMIKLHTLTPGKGERDFVMGATSGHPFGGGPKHTTGEDSLPVTAKKWGEHSYAIQSTNALGPGEYAFLYGQQAYCFSIAAK